VATDGPPVREVEVSADWVRAQLEDLAGRLGDEVPRVKAEFRKLNLASPSLPSMANLAPTTFVWAPQSALAAKYRQARCSRRRKSP